MSHRLPALLTVPVILLSLRWRQRSGTDVLAEAQALGYVKRTQRLTSMVLMLRRPLLASLAFGARIDANAPFKQGVDSVAPADIEYARELGYRIKHLGIAKRENDALQLGYTPR